MPWQKQVCSRQLLQPENEGMGEAACHSSLSMAPVATALQQRVTTYATGRPMRQN